MPPPISPTTRIARLEDAKKRIVEAGNIGKLTAQPMAQMLGVQWTTLRDWTRLFTPAQSKGVFIVGGNGAEYSFHPLKTVNLLIKHFTAEQTKKARRHKRTTDALGIEVDSEHQPDLAELSKLVALTAQITEMKVKQGKLVPTEDVTALFREHNRWTQERILGVGSQQDPTGQWPAELRAKFDEGLRQVSAEVSARGRQLEADFRARIKSEGASARM